MLQILFLFLIDVDIPPATKIDHTQITYLHQSIFITIVPTHTDGGTSSWTANVNLDIDIFVISEPKWLKFGLQAHFFKVFGHAKFQLSITSTFKVIKLLVKVTKYLH